MNKGASGSLSGLGGGLGLGGLSGIVQRLLLLQGIRDLSGVAKEVKVLADSLLRGRAAAECVVVEGILRLVEAVA